MVRKKYLLMIALLLCINCSSQMKINTSKEVDIIVTNKNNFLDGRERKLLIRNNTKTKTFIIDSNLGFYGNTYYLNDNGEIKTPDFPSPKYTRSSRRINECKKDIIILMPNQKILRPLNLNFNSPEIHVFKKNKNYTQVIKTSHIIVATYFSECEEYIKQLQKKGYVVLDDNIDAKFPFKGK